MSDHPVELHREGPPETVLDDEPEAAVAALQEALRLEGDARRDAVAAVVAAHPGFLDGWAHLGEHGRDPVERYAAYRVGYHRGLDRLRHNGWRGNGHVRWQHLQNRGFLRALEGLRIAALALGELDEAERCELFLRQLDPNWPPGDHD